MLRRNTRRKSDEDHQNPDRYPAHPRGRPACRHARGSRTAATHRYPAHPDRRGDRGHRPDVLRRRHDRRAAHRGGRTRRADRGRGPAADRGDRAQAAPRRGGFLRPGRYLYPCAVGDRRRAVGHQGQGAGAAAVEAARRHPRPGEHLCVGLAAPRADRRQGRHRRAPAGGQGLHRDEDADGAARQSLARRGGAPRACGARGDRPRHQADVRHQPALARRTGDRYRPSRRRGGAVLAGGRHHLRRFCRFGADQRSAVHTDRGRRICLGDHAVPPDDRGALGRLRDDRSVPRRRRDAVDEGRRHGRGVQPARGQPCRFRKCTCT